MANPPKLELITGYRAQIEDRLVRALFTPDVERQIPILLAQLERTGDLHLVTVESSHLSDDDLP